MDSVILSIAKQVKAFCAHIGTDPLLVQGAGGNVSWKDGNLLWIKASGMWLADAEVKEIFVPVNLKILNTEILRNNFSVMPLVENKSELRPSIETLLHALMSHRVVVHLHAVEVLAHLVQIDAEQKIAKLFEDSFKWIFVDYFKPGAELAKEIFDQLKNKPESDIVFLRNHGIVVGGQDVGEILAKINLLTSIASIEVTKVTSEKMPIRRESDFLALGYMPHKDYSIYALFNKNLFLDRTRNEWALYPDHVVFLGSKATILEKNFTLDDLIEAASHQPPFIFAVDEGVYEQINVKATQLSQLRCYYDVMSRQTGSDNLSVLSAQQINELLDWDAEKYRQNIPIIKK
jgi:rhamnose utilization protein RhaD (predicted bifunctional aldolase and dehydrogenase)